MSKFITTGKPKNFRVIVCCLDVVARAALYVWRVITSLGRLRGCEGRDTSLNHMDVGN